MLKFPFRISLLTVIAATALLAACGGGGGTPPITPPAQGADGTLSVNGSALADASVVFSCGCSGQAGVTAANGSGEFSFGTTATATPAAPSPTYTTVPGRNYMVIGANATTHQEAWTMLFLGNRPSHNVYIGAGGANTTDVATTAAALYIFLEAQDNSDTSFDGWNLNTIDAWAQELRTTPKTAQEQKLLTDISSAEAAGTPLYPTIPPWDNDLGAPNSTIYSDIEAIQPSSDSAVPTPCPLSGGSPACTGAPTP